MYRLIFPALLLIIIIIFTTPIIPAFQAEKPKPTTSLTHRTELNGPLTIKADQQLIVQGENTSNDEQVLVVRIDDKNNPGYADRINLERVIPPGPFELQFPLGGLRTPAGRPIATEAIQRIIAFDGRETQAVVLNALELAQAPTLDNGALGWDLGPDDSAVWPGFQAMNAGYPGLSGPMLKAIDRSGRKQATEGLTTDGIRGIETLTLPLPKGQWFITLWMHDRGEWEYLPHPLKRQVLANGQPVWSQHFSSEEWTQTIYLRGQAQEPSSQDDAWSLYGLHPHAQISFEVQVQDNGLTLDFQGDQPEAGYLSAVLAEPTADYRARKNVEAERARWWRNNWPIQNWPQPNATQPALIPIDVPTAIAADTSASLTFDLQQGKYPHAPQLSLQNPQKDGVQLTTDVRWGRWHVRRSSMASTLLVPSNQHLRGTELPAQQTDQLPRRLHLRVHVPRAAPAGHYQGQLSITLGEQKLTQQLNLQVAKAQLPAANRPIGVYLERPVHFDWFENTQMQSQLAMNCDLNFLRKEGITGISPPLSTPNTAEDLQQFSKEISMTHNAGFTPPFFAYTPFKRLAASLGVEKAAIRLQEVETALKLAGLPPPIWSIADEPSNPGQIASMDTLLRYLDTYAPTARLGAQLNHRSDDSHPKFPSIVLINNGYGIDRDRIRHAQKKRSEVWFYNLGHPRAAAGFFLWQMDAKGYLQWHARMPTAAPFDPTDGREDDVQLLYPMLEACPNVPDVDARLFELTEGITDLRWMLWLEQQATHRPAAKTLLQQLRRDIPTQWEKMKNVSHQQLRQWRQSIIKLAI